MLTVQRVYELIDALAPFDTQADFDRVKEKLATGQEPWTADYNKLMTSKHVDLNWKPNPTV